MDSGLTSGLAQVDETVALSEQLGQVGQIEKQVVDTQDIQEQQEEQEEQKQQETRTPKWKIIMGVVGMALLLVTVLLVAFILYNRMHTPQPPPKPQPGRPNYWDPKIFNHYTENGSGVLVKRDPVRVIGGILVSFVKVILTVVVPVFIIVTTGAYLLTSRNALPMALRMTLTIMVTTFFMTFIFQVGFPSLDELLLPTSPESAIEALRVHNTDYFVYHPVEYMSMTSFASLLFYFLQDAPVYLSGNTKTADNGEQVNTTSSVGADMLRDDHSFLPPNYTPNTEGVEFAGRSKLDDSVRVTVSTPDTWTPWSHRGHHVQQYGDDCAGANTANRVFVVADGVSGSEIPAHARYASLSAVLACLERVGQDGATVSETVEPLLAQLVSFFNRTELCGSTTVTVAQITNGELHVAQLGDSTCMVVRAGVVVFHTTATVHSFNCPYQLSREWTADSAAVGHYKFKLKNGDRIYLYSDGVGDNLWSRDVAVLGVAGRIAAKAVQVFSQCLTADIPFNERLETYTSHGKRDDVSVISIDYRS